MSEERWGGSREGSKRDRDKDGAERKREEKEEEKEKGSIYLVELDRCQAHQRK